MPGPFVLAATAPVGWIIVALAVYVLVGIPVVFWGLARTGKRGLAWVLLPVLSGIATTALWLYVHQPGYR
jgi:hypothetical protein